MSDYIRQKWNKIRGVLNLIPGGVGITGKTPTVAILRENDSNWLQNGGGSWGAGFATNDMTEVDATNLQGVYTFQIDAADIDVELGGDGYWLYINETDTGTTKAVFVESVLDITLARLNTILNGTTHDAAGRLLTGTLVSYPTAVDANAGTNAELSMDVDNSYDSLGNLTQSKVTKA